ncbi:DnaJ-like cysteine-rich domain-containing protein [Geomonas edaphica]|uniref:hypothetical protein n=1 Tax=Geomonas edaphica TaxID=2570226 RepID=UPI0010A84DB5|nr:hypothetical protein [Geomonas edaphica]
MGTITEITVVPPTHEEILSLLDEWGWQAPMQPRYLSAHYKVTKILSMSVFSYRLKSQFETRWDSIERKPYRGGPLDNEGTPPSIWDMPLDTPKIFETSRHLYRIPHTDKVEACKCVGGKITCPDCSGTGRSSCFWCFGSGHVTRTGNDGSSHTSSTTCLHCHGSGRHTCTKCKGRGKITCPTCDGTTKILSYRVMNARYVEEEFVDVVHQAELPELPVEMVRESGSKIVLQDGAPILTAEGFPDVLEVNDRLNELIEQSHLLKMKLWYQEVVTVQQIGDATKATVWICGTEKKLFVSDFPVITSQTGVCRISCAKCAGYNPMREAGTV